MIKKSKESFLPIMPYETIEEAILLANATAFGLTASVWSKDRKKAMKVASRIEAGTVIINDAIYTHAMAETPWGGVKNSGIGRVHSDMGFTNPIHINKPAWINIDLWWYPYTQRSFNFFKNSIFLFSGNTVHRLKGLLGFASWNTITFGKKKDDEL